MAFTCLPSICGIAIGVSGTVINPDRRSNPASRGPASIREYGGNIPIAALNSAQARCLVEPAPAEPYCIFVWFAFV